MQERSSNKRTGSDDVPDEQRTKRRKTASVRFVGIGEENETPSGDHNGGGRTQIYTEEDVQRIRRLRKNKISEKTRDYLDTEIPQSFRDASYIPEPGEPPIEPFSMDSDLRYGRFDEEGMFIFKRRPRADDQGSDSDDSVHDPWYASVRNTKVTSTTSNQTVENKKEESPTPSSEHELSQVDANKMLLELYSHLESNETPVQALKRLKERAIVVEDYKPTKTSIPQSSNHEDDDAEGRIDREASRQRSKLQRRKPSIKKKMSEDDQKAFDRVTELADMLMLGVSMHNVLYMTRDAILKLANDQAGKEEISDNQEMLWQFRWRNSSDQAIYGPYSSSDLYAWVQAGYIKDATPVDLREVTPDGEPIDGIWRDWTSVRLEGKQFKTEAEETTEEEERRATRREEEERKSRKEAELEDSDDEI